MSFPFPRGQNVTEEKMGEDFAKLHVCTRIQVSHAKPLENCDPVVVPIYQTTAYRFKTAAQWSEPNHGSNYCYQRCGNPTTENVEVIINEIEQGQGTLLYSSGLAAGTAVFLEFLDSKSHMICMIPIYSGTFTFFVDTLVRWGVEITFIDVDAEGDNLVQAVEKAMKPNTKLVFCEIFGNPTVSIPDVLGTIEVAHKHNAIYLIDTTFASPYIVQPIKFGADLVLHSCSKYLGGHTDIIGGCVTCRDEANWGRLKSQQLTTGSSMSPFDASLLARGIKTLAIRLDRISDNAMIVAQHLEKHPKVKWVKYPGLESHPGHKYANQMMSKFSGMMAFDVGTAEKATKLVENLRIIVHSISLGGTESKIEHPLSMSHGKQLITKGWPGTIPEGMLRFSIGLENPNDIIVDLDQALEKI
ncbi:hypothetical protein WR25_19506 isoform A [Diploscapter pachys]|uniref:Uncharacterized protein n=2 Tax=Diploscapter pachys TaxID=2018661 RepID=A0A2A2K0R7_9BILA|nr:hypothetical protein WR25_19506 isoform A [Diploscapter pachys]